MYRALVPIDESVERTTAQAQAVGDLPDAENSVEATLLYVEDGETQPTDLDAGERATSYLRDRDVTTETRAADGDPSTAIVDAADDVDADVIVLGGRKRSPLGSLLFGSVSQSVALAADRPVTITGSAAVEEPSGAAEGEPAEEEAEAVSDVVFQKRNVRAGAEHQISFYGSFSYRDDGERHVVERTFDVYTEPGHRTEDGLPIADVEETRSVERDSGDQDAEQVESNERTIVIDVDPDLPDRLEETRIERFLNEWHETHRDVA